jgi:hypothetical protein
MPDVADVLEQVMSDAAANRKAVLAHPDLAERLTRPLLGYSKPEQWNGFVPPEQFGQQINDSPRRAALVAILDEAFARDERRRAS